LIHLGANEDTEAWKYLEIALIKATKIGDQFIIGRALELMGYGYLRRGDFKNAYVYEAALVNYRGTVDEGDERTWPKSRSRKTPMRKSAFTELALMLTSPLSKHLRAAMCPFQALSRFIFLIASLYTSTDMSTCQQCDSFSIPQLGKEKRQGGRLQ
jgi:hypothetical protein